MNTYKPPTKKDIKSQISSTMKYIKTLLMDNVDRFQRTWKWDNILFELLEIVNTDVQSSKPENHKTTTLIHLNEPIEIDEMIAPLISEIWKAKIITLNSCENNIPKGYIWIQFDTGNDCTKFLNIIFKNLDINASETKDIYTRAMNYQDYKLEGRWIYDVNIDSIDNSDLDDSNLLDNSNSLGNSDSKTDSSLNLSKVNPVLFVETNISVRFPQIDLDFIYKRFLEHNSKSNS